MSFEDQIEMTYLNFKGRKNCEVKKQGIFQFKWMSYHQKWVETCACDFETCDLSVCWSNDKHVTLKHVIAACDFEACDFEACDFEACEVWEKRDFVSSFIIHHDMFLLNRKFIEIQKKILFFKHSFFN